MSYSSEKASEASALFTILLVMMVGMGSAVAGSPEIRTDKDVYAPNEPITVHFRNAPGNRANGISLLPKDTPDNQTKAPGGRGIYLQGRTEGTHSFARLAAGEYEARLFADALRGEIAARYAFRVGNPATAKSADEKKTAQEKAASPKGHQPGKGGEMPAPAKPLSPELQRLVGTWIAHTRCDTQGNGEMRPQQVRLTVRADGTKASGISAEVRGIDGTAGIALDTVFDSEHRQYRFAYTGWLSSGQGAPQKPYGLALAFLDDRELLHGEVTGRTDCATVVAGRLPSEDAPPNPKGLLYKVAVNRVLEPLTEQDCAGYASWLAAGELFTVYGHSVRFNSAVTDGPAMRRVLGHDLEQWTDEDGPKSGVIHRACHKLLKASADPALIALANHKQIWMNIAVPLWYQKSKYPDIWGDTYFALYRPLLADILKAWSAIEEGLLAQPTYAAAPAPKDETGLVGEWRGYYRCQGGNEVFMRLTFAVADGPFDVRFEFGPSLKTIHPFGSLSMKGRFDAGSRQITLDPRDWIQQPRGGIGPGAAAGIRPIGFEGRLSEGGRVIEGKGKGNPDCPDFSVTKREIMRKPINPEGLLFHYLARDMITATVADCRAYAEWLVAGEEINLGGIYVFSGLRSSDATRAVLGKDLYQWGEEDHTKMYSLSRHCKALLESQMDPEISDLLVRMAKKKLTWAPEPLETPHKDDNSHWLRVEQLVMVNERQQALAAQKLAQAQAMPAVIGSLDNIDALAEEAGKRSRGPFDYLSKQELDAYIEGLQAARVQVPVATAGATAEAWSSRPQTYADLQQVEAQYRSLREQLESKKALQGVDALSAAFGRESDRRADALWADILEKTLEELHTLAEADLARFSELNDDQERQSYLARFHGPKSGDRYFESYQSARTLYRETVDRMVERSQPQLLAWIDGLPPSGKANDLLDQFSVGVFGVAPIPEQHPGLRQATAAKKQAYNPDGYLRPDIVMSLRRGQWNEVGLVGLDDLAYMTTSLRTIKHSCPGGVPEGSGPLMSFALNLSKQSVGRIMQGQVQNRQEAERAFFLFMNTLFNQPGCTVDYLGNVIGCVSEQDHAAVQEFFMTSGEAQSDMRTLLRSGCGPDGANGYVEGLVAYAGSDLSQRPAPVVLDFWQFLASHE